ncbi:heparan-alpha-glucosaminide N-acetyltransferase [Thermococcus sp. 21S7]|uniref:heparan-alpha-glucosaminide N-acetyltransferase n=1 Tax=Thermococcus sp. 21S7 TaxID=1638221 RepID=UPI00143B109B|nr:heparan-alpha-glucosaminide N-acetyltransferase [Thermococcus sp. 21S7]NJE61087.1 DUF1624 domain-containing protein [Thermococcus sp. 21S7]
MFGSDVYTDRRYWEIDLLRGVGITMMVVSNFITDLQLFLGYSSHRDFWMVFAITTATIFVFASGLSMWISYSRTLGKKPGPHLKYLRRFFKLFGMGLLITATTHSLGMTVHFGILHLLAVATLLGMFFHRFGSLNALWAAFFILGYLVIRNFHDGPWLLPVGIMPENYFAPDYFPVFPWFGVFLLGMAAGSVFYPDGRRKQEIFLPSNPLVHFAAFAGRHTLLIYVIHQPILVGLLRLIHGPLPGLPV